LGNPLIFVVFVRAHPHAMAYNQKIPMNNAGQGNDSKLAEGQGAQHAPFTGFFVMRFLLMRGRDATVSYHGIEFSLCAHFNFG
jgi:hypothetical protein